MKAYLRRASLYSTVEKYQEAVYDYEKAKQLDPENRGWLFLFYFIYFSYAHFLTKQSYLETRGKLREAEADLKRSKRKDYYKILGIPKTASEAEIKKAYKKLALQWHPGMATYMPTACFFNTPFFYIHIDKHGSSEEAAKQAEEKFKDVGEAYSVLSDPKKKARFDSGADMDDMMGGGGFNSDVDVNDIFNMFFQGGGGFPGGGFSSGGFPGGGYPGGGGGRSGGGGRRQYYSSGGGGFPGGGGGRRSHMHF